MRKLWKDILLSLFLGMVVPWMILNFAVSLMEAPPAAVPEATVSQASVVIGLRGADAATAEMDLESYLVGVVLAEMPAYFEPEALKAQAVVARTYTLRAHTTGGKHGDGSLCADPGCCQAYITEADYLAKGGTQESVAKIQAAVEATRGQVLTYEGGLIEATYFSCSGGATEDAAAVWGTDYPYLQSVASPGEEEAACYETTVTYQESRLRTLLGLGNATPLLGTVTYTEGGGVDTMVLGGKTFRGTELRTLLGLRSTAFTITQSGSTITITTKGYGHRVGMSQYGADAMAVTGKGYQEILSHYYRGTELEEIQVKGDGTLGWG